MIDDFHLFIKSFNLQAFIEQQWVSLVAQLVKNLPAMQETQVQSLGVEDPLEKETETHSSILACKIPWIEEPVRLQSMGVQRVRHDLATKPPQVLTFWPPRGTSFSNSFLREVSPFSGLYFIFPQPRTFLPCWSHVSFPPGSQYPLQSEDLVFL